MIPNSSIYLTPLLRQRYPHKLLPTSIHVLAASNLLHSLTYAPDLRQQIFLMIIDNMLNIDVSIQDTGYNSIATHSSDLSLLISQESSQWEEKLDSLMDLMLQFLDSQPLEEQDFYWQTLVSIFDAVIIQVYKSTYTQYLIFYYSHKNHKYEDMFLEYLQNKVTNTAMQLPIRIAAASYLGGICARSKDISHVSVKSVLKFLTQWLNQYLSVYEGEPPDASKHSLFYTVCQALFYIIWYKPNTFNSTADFSKSSIATIIQSSLKPLKFCHSKTAKEFSKLVGANHLFKEQSTHSTFGNFYKLSFFFPFKPYTISTHETTRRFTEIYQEQPEYSSTNREQDTNFWGFKGLTDGTSPTNFGSQGYDYVLETMTNSSPECMSD